MKYKDDNKGISLEKKEINIVDTAISELGGPFHSPLAKHLQVYHYKDYDRIRKDLNSTGNVSSSDLHLVIDILQVFISEPLESDWGTTYEKISVSDVNHLLKELTEAYIVTQVSLDGSKKY